MKRSEDTRKRCSNYVYVPQSGPHQGKFRRCDRLAPNHTHPAFKNIGLCNSCNLIVMTMRAGTDPLTCGHSAWHLVSMHQGWKTGDGMCLKCQTLVPVMIGEENGVRMASLAL